MALEDREIFAAICNRYPDQPMEFIMGEYEKARTMNRQIEQRETQDAADAASQLTDVEEVESEVEEEEIPLRKRFPRRTFKVKPEHAITDDLIYCCICGEARQNLTAKHLEKHGLTPDEYREVCRYPMNQPLMSNKHLARSREVVANAQRARLSRRAGPEGDNNQQNEQG